MQSQWKLSRAHGIANLIVLHRLSDLDATGAAGSQTRAVAEGLLADCSTRVIYRQESDQTRPHHRHAGADRPGTRDHHRPAPGHRAVEAAAHLPRRCPPAAPRRGRRRRHRPRHARHPDPPCACGRARSEPDTARQPPSAPCCGTLARSPGCGLVGRSATSPTRGTPRCTAPCAATRPAQPPAPGRSWRGAAGPARSPSARTCPGSPPWPGPPHPDPTRWPTPAWSSRPPCAGRSPPTGWCCAPGPSRPPHNATPNPCTTPLHHVQAWTQQAQQRWQAAHGGGQVPFDPDTAATARTHVLLGADRFLATHPTPTADRRRPRRRHCWSGPCSRDPGRLPTVAAIGAGDLTDPVAAAALAGDPVPGPRRGAHRRRHGRCPPHPHGPRPR